jgi:hypothetical protein
MSFTVADAINEARDKHRAFTKQHTPDRVLLRHLNNYQRRLYFFIHKRNPDQYVSVSNIAFPLATFASGSDLSGLTMALPLGGTINLTASTLKGELTIVPWRRRFQPGQGPAAYIQQDTLFFVGVAEDWAHVSSVDFYYVPEPTALAAETDTVGLPDGARLSCVCALTVFMSERGPQDKTMPIPLREFKTEAAAAEADFLDEIGRGRRAKTFVVGEAW